MTDIETLYNCFEACGNVTTDSRHCPEGSLFIALKGETFDGNAFAAQALQKGCRYAVVDEAAYAPAGDPRILLVDDCLKTLQHLANHHRQKLGTPVIGITGTNGKTTTKELVSAVLREKYDVLSTEGNLNNHIGVPLTLLRLTPSHQLAVVEMGASHPGDIKELVDIAEPDYGLITNVGRAHLQGFGSFEGVIRTKGELYDYLRTKPNGTIFIENENPYLNRMAEGLHCIRYGQADRLYVSGTTVATDSPFLSFRWSAEGGETHLVHTRLIGSYNLDNVLAAATVGHYFGVSDASICHAIASYIPRNDRSELKETAHNRLIIDAYNANPTSMKAALDNFRQLRTPHKRVILGAMKELGAYSAAEHQQIVDYVTTCGFEQIILVGREFEETRHPGCVCYPDVEAVISQLQENRPEGCCILIKGSNSMKLERLPQYL